MKAKGTRSRYTEVNTGSDYTDDERQFMMAMENFKVTRNCPYPTAGEVLSVLRSLGYRKARRKSDRRPTIEADLPVVVG